MCASELGYSQPINCWHSCLRAQAIPFLVRRRTPRSMWKIGSLSLVTRTIQRSEAVDGAVKVPFAEGCNKSRRAPISRILSIERVDGVVIPLGSPSPTNSSNLPGSWSRRSGTGSPHKCPLPYLVLLHMGFTLPPTVTGGAVRSYRTVSPLPCWAEAQP